MYCDFVLFIFVLQEGFLLIFMEFFVINLFSWILRNRRLDFTVVSYFNGTNTLFFIPSSKFKIFYLDFKFGILFYWTNCEINKIYNCKKYDQIDMIIKCLNFTLTFFDSLLVLFHRLKKYNWMAIQKPIYFTGIRTHRTVVKFFRKKKQSGS